FHLSPLLPGLNSTPARCLPHFPRFLFLVPGPPRSTVFPYTTLFRSVLGEDVVTPEVAAAWDEVYWLMAKVLIDYERELYRSAGRSEEHTSELQSRFDLVCRLLLEKKNNTIGQHSER